MHLNYIEREERKWNVPFISRFLSSTLVTLKAPQELIAKYPRASTVASKLIALERLRLGGKDVTERKGRPTHSPCLVGFHHVSRMQRGHTHKAHRCPVWTLIFTHSRDVREEEKGVNRMTKAVWFVQSTLCPTLAGLSQLTGHTNWVYILPLWTQHWTPSKQWTLGKTCRNFIIHQSICVLGQLGHILTFTTAQKTSKWTPTVTTAMNKNWCVNHVAGLYYW